MTYVLFDVGANWGNDSLNKTKDDPNIKTFAFEPTPELITHLQESSKDFSDRYTIIPFAVSDFNGGAKFNIADNPGCDWGCSSLNTFNDNLQETWPGRTDFQVNRVVDVRVTRLDTWFQENNIVLDKIDFFHCDTQGSDLKVLQRMGDYVHLIKEGVVECATGERGKLYKENHTEQEMRAFLESKGFRIHRTHMNDPYGNEINLFFEKV